jgi:CBS-domain-containing membrane protein
MNASEIMVGKVITDSEETVAKALRMMHENDIYQIPIVDDNRKYLGMVC